MKPMRRISAKKALVSYLFRALMVFLVGTGDGSSHRFGGIPLPSAHRLPHLAIDDQGMAVVHEHLPPVAGQCWVGIGFPDR